MREKTARRIRRNLRGDAKGIDQIIAAGHEYRWPSGVAYLEKVIAGEMYAGPLLRERIRAAKVVLREFMR
jgi:hypothetical protein